MSMLAWAAGGFLLGLLILAIRDFLNWLATPFTIAVHAMFAVEQAQRREEVERKRVEAEVRRWQAQMQLNDHREQQP